MSFLPSGAGRTARDLKPPHKPMGTSWQDKHWKLLVFPGGESGSRASRWKIAVSRKVLRNATARNRWKRRLREVLRQHEPAIRLDRQASFQLLRAGDEPDFKELQREVLELLNRGGLLAPREPRTN